MSYKAWIWCIGSVDMHEWTSLFLLHGKYYSRVNSFDPYSGSPSRGPSAVATFHPIPTSSLIFAKNQKSCDCLLGFFSSK